MTIFRAEMPTADPIVVRRWITGHPHVLESVAGRTQQCRPSRATDEDVIAPVAVEVANVEAIKAAKVPASDPFVGAPDAHEVTIFIAEEREPLAVEREHVGTSVPREVPHVEVVRA